MIDLNENLSHYIEKLFKFIKCTHCTDKIGSAENAHWMHTSVVIAVKLNIKYCKLNIYVFGFTAQWVQKVRQIKIAIRCNQKCMFCTDRGIHFSV